MKIAGRARIWTRDSLTVCSATARRKGQAEQPTGCPVAAARRVTGGLFGSSAGGGINTIAFLPISAAKRFDKLPKAVDFVSQSGAHARRTPSPPRRNLHLPARRLCEGRDRP